MIELYPWLVFNNEQHRPVLLGRELSTNRPGLVELSSLPLMPLSHLTIQGQVYRLLGEPGELDLRLVEQLTEWMRAHEIYWSRPII